MSIYKLYGGATNPGSSGSQVNSADIRADGEVVALSLEVLATSLAVAELGAAELSFNAQGSLEANDVRHSLALVQTTYSGDPTNPTGIGADRVVLTGLRIPVRQGERLYIHVFSGNGTAVVTANAYLYVNDGFDERLRQR